VNDKQLELVIRSRTIVISEDVNSTMAGEITRLVNFMEKEDPAAPILVTINSPGGEAYTGLGIYDTLRASAGIVILLSGERQNRATLASSRFMIHQPSGGASGTASDIEIKAENMKALREMYFEIIAKRCGRQVGEVTDRAKRDFWLSAAEAKEYGLVDKIITKKSELGLDATRR
jgi:ATP-dependent Clp protease, protease subunit